jgi:hypothetical protein
VFMRVGGLDCFNQKPSSIVTSVFFITNRPLGAQFILDECIGLKATVEKVSLQKSPDGGGKPSRVSVILRWSLRLGWPKPGRAALRSPHISARPNLAPLDIQVMNMFT